MINSPGLSSVPARIEPSITEFAPAAIDFVISPENLIPPSAIIGTLSFTALTTSIIAVSWGIPAPVIILVVQIEPGPTPTLTASTPKSTKSCAALYVAILPAIKSIEEN